MKRFTVLLLALALVLSLTACAASDYKKAQSLMSDRKWEEAKEILDALGDYKNAAEDSRKCDYKMAEEYFDSGKYDKAMKLLKGLDYQGSDELYNECFYEQALDELSAGRYETAAEAFQKLKDYKDSEEKLVEAYDKQANKLFEEDKYEEALEIYKKAGHTDDSDPCRRCRYFIAVNYLQLEETEKALAIFKELGDYEESARYVRDIESGLLRAALVGSWAVDLDVSDSVNKTIATVWTDDVDDFFAGVERVSCTLPLILSFSDDSFEYGYDPDAVKAAFTEIYGATGELIVNFYGRALEKECKEQGVTLEQVFDHYKVSSVWELFDTVNGYTVKSFQDAYYTNFTEYYDGALHGLFEAEDGETLCLKTDELGADYSEKYTCNISNDILSLLNTADGSDHILFPFDLPAELHRCKD